MPVSNVVIRGGKIDSKSLAHVLSQISRQSGNGGTIEGAYFKDADFTKMNAYASGLVGKSAIAGGYGDWSLGNNCGTFPVDVLKRGGVSEEARLTPASMMSGLQSSKSASGFRFESGGFQGTFMVEGRIDSKRLDEELSR